MLFPKKDLIELTWCDVGDTFNSLGVEYVVVDSKLVGKTRWSLQYEMIFRCSEKYYSVIYNRAATECQDESPFEHSPDMVDCREVKPVEKTIVVYEPV